MSFVPKSLAGKCRNGFQSDAGTLFHALPKDHKSFAAALCGAFPQGMSAGWSTWEPEGAEINCSRCLTKIKKLKGK